MKGNLPVLRMLTLLCDDFLLEGVRDAFEIAPQLQQVALSSHACTSDLRLPWSQLTRVTLNPRFDYNVCKILARTPNVRALLLERADAHPSSFESIVLPSLRTFLASHSSCQFFAALTLPSLKEIILNKSQPDLVISQCIQRSGCALNKLDLKGDILWDLGILEILRACANSH